MAVSLVAHINITGGTGGGTSGAIDTTGSTLLIIVASNYGPGTGATVSDNKSNTWTPLTFQFATNGVKNRIFYASNPTVGSSHTFTVAGTDSSGCVQAFSGIITTSPEESQNGSTNAGTTVTSIQPGSVTPAENGALVIAGVGAGATFNSTGLSIDSSFNITDTVAFQASNHYGTSSAYLIQGTAAAVDPTWTFVSSNTAAATVAVFTPVTSASASASFGGVGGFTASATPAVVSTAAFPAVGQFSAAATQGGVETVNFPAVGAFAAAGIPAEVVSATFAGVGGFTVSSTQGPSGAAIFPGMGAFSAAAIAGPLLSATFPAMGAFSAAGSIGSLPAATFSATAAFTLAASLVTSPTVTFSGMGQFSLAASFRQPVSATFAAMGQLLAMAFVQPIFPATAGDLIVVDATAGGFGSTDVTRQTFQSSNVSIFDPQQVFNYGAIFVLAAGFNMAEASNPVCTLIFTKPDGTQYIVASPFVYVGTHDLPTYEGRFLGGFYVLFVFGPGILVRGQWSVYLQFQTTPQTIPILSETGTFQI